MAVKKGIGSYPAESPESGPSGGGETSSQDDVDRGTRSNKMRKDDKGDLANDADRIQSDRDKYRDEMAEDAPASDSPEDQQ
jgi:hypothetical protein